MKKLAKVLSLALVLVMVLSLGGTAWAAETTISVASGDTHEYSVYQIFKGDISGSILSNLVWGKNGTGTENEAVASEVIDALTAIASDATDAAKLTTIKTYANLTGDAFGTVKAGENLTAPTSYYLIKDKDAITGDDAATT